MSKLLATVSAIGVLALIALPVTASARDEAGASMKNSNSIEVSSARRHYRSYRHYGYRPYYRHRYGYYGGPYNAYAYDPYYRPYYRPGFSVGVGPFGFGLGF
jgi:urocanate hydratase